MKLFSIFNQDLAIDLGTANTLIIQDGEVVVDEPSIVAVNRRTNEVIAVGHKAMQMHEKTHEDIKTIRPLKDGVIADFQAAEKMIEGLINMVGQRIKEKNSSLTSRWLFVFLLVSRRWKNAQYLIQQIMSTLKKPI